MFITELAEPTLLVIYPGRFQPWHRGHNMVYEYLTGKFGRNNVYIATSNKTDNLKSPFTFAEKAYFMQLTGVPADRVVQATNPYQIANILSGGQITVTDPNNTVVIFAVSEKDMAEDPRFSFQAKKDGSTPYFQPLKDIKQTESMDKHGYIMTVPTFDFDVAGVPMRSGTELRKMYADSNQLKRQQIIQSLFGRYTQDAEQIMNNKILAGAPVPDVKLGKKVKLQKVAKPEPMDETVSHFVPSKSNSEHGYYKMLAYKYKKDPRLLSAKEKQELQDFIQTRMIKEEAGGVGVIATKKQARDPRYSTSLTKDVRPGQINKNLRALKLAESNIDKLAAQLIDHINQDLDAIKERMATEKLPAAYKQMLKNKIEQLKNRRHEIMMGR